MVWVSRVFFFVFVFRFFCWFVVHCFHFRRLFFPLLFRTDDGERPDVDGAVGKASRHRRDAAGALG